MSNLPLPQHMGAAVLGDAHLDAGRDWAKVHERERLFLGERAQRENLELIRANKKNQKKMSLQTILKVFKNE